MPLWPESRSAQYRDYADDLRRLAGRAHIDVERQRLTDLADEFDRLAESLERSDLILRGYLPARRP